MTTDNKVELLPCPRQKPRQPNNIKIHQRKFSAFSFSYKEAIKLKNWFTRLVEWQEEKQNDR